MISNAKLSWVIKNSINPMGFDLRRALKEASDSVRASQYTHTIHKIFLFLFTQVVTLYTPQG